MNIKQAIEEKIHKFEHKHMDDQIKTQSTPPDTEEASETEVEESEEEAKDGEVETPVVPVQAKNPSLNCQDCKGEGLNEAQTALCSRCHGTGRV